MDDSKTQEALDALADLFLTQTLGDRGAPAGRGSAADQLEGPSPIRLTPKVAQPRTVTAPPADLAAAPAVPEAFEGVPAAPMPDDDAPVLRFTGDADDESFETQAPPAEPAPAEALVEAVVLGNLPGLAGPWLTQYAQVLADEAGPVLVIHVDEDDADGDAAASGGRLDLELVEPAKGDGDSASHGSVRVPPMRGSGPDLAIGLIDSMVRARVGKVSTILLHLEAGTDERRLSRLMAADDWTLLCGHDEMAVAGAGSLLSGWVEADERVKQKQIALMVMGADAASGQAAAARVAETAAASLDLPVLTLGSHQRLGPVNVRQLGSFENLGVLWPRLLAYLEDLAPPAVVEEPPAEPEDAPAAELRPVPQRTPPAHEPERAPESAEAPQPVATPDEAATEPAAPEAAAAREAPAPTPRRDPAFDAILKAKAPEPRTRKAAITGTEVPEPRPARSVPAPEASPASSGVSAPDPQAPPRLAGLVAAGAHGIEGGVALEARCPYQPLTELVLDHAGRLHLLRREVAVAGGEDESAGIRAAVVDLSEAGRWVADHVELLKLTMRDAIFDADAAPTLHLFTDKAHLATRVVAKLGDQVKLHLLQQVNVGDQSTWFCTPLS